MFARNTYGESAQAAGSLGRKSEKTLSCVSSVVRVEKSGAYTPDQRNVRPSTRSSPARSTWCDWNSSVCAAGKSVPTTPTSRTGARNDAATEK